MGLVTVNADSPDDLAGSPKVGGIYTADDGTIFSINATQFPLPACGSDLIRSPTTGLVDGVETNMPIAENSLVMIKDPAANCVHSQGTVGLTILVMICFSACVQAAEGLHYGIVPYISRPALGVVSGMVGAGGNFGALMSSKYIVGAKNLYNGFITLGFIIIGGSLSMLLIFFPGEGGIILPASFPYDPQLVKPTEGQKGSDELDFSKVTNSANPPGSSGTASA